MKMRHKSTLLAAAAERRPLGLGGILLVLVLALSSQAEAECGMWDVSGDWFPKGGDDWSFHLTLRGSEITGTASRGPKLAKVTGRLDFSNFYLLIPSQSLEFRGQIGTDNKVHGTMFDLHNENRKLIFNSSRAMKCLHENAASVPQPQTPVKTAPLPPAPVDPAPPPKATPNISASPVDVRIPLGRANGTTTLTWDGGPSHAYAEVWVAVNGQDPTFVVEQGKGSRTVTVERGVTYRYILTDSGKDLGSVKVGGK